MNSLDPPSTNEILDICDILNRVLQRADALLECVDIALQNPYQTPNPHVLCIAMQVLTENLQPVGACVDRLLALLDGGDRSAALPLARQPVMVCSF